MGMPKIPEGTYRPNTDELFIDLLESIALDQMAMSHLLNAHGELLQEAVKQWSCKKIDFCELQVACNTTNKILEDSIMKEWMARKKIASIIEAMDKKQSSISNDTDCCFFNKFEPSSIL
ncbi:MAG: hypothetical protein ACRC7V_05700 [Lachnospiraceae bacterium]